LCGFCGEFSDKQLEAAAGMISWALKQFAITMMKLT